MSDHKEETKPAEVAASEPVADKKQNETTVEAPAKDKESEAPANGLPVELAPGTVVLAKVKGFPAWPGIVSLTDSTLS